MDLRKELAKVLSRFGDQACSKEDLDLFEQAWTALSHIGDGSKAEPRCTACGFTKEAHSNPDAEFDVDSYPCGSYTRPAPTAQDSKVPEEWRLAMSQLVQAARTTGGTAGPDELLKHVCSQCEELLSAAPVPAKPQVPDEWHSAVVTLSNAEAHYRNTHDLYGDGDLKTGRAWDLLRRAGDKARKLLDTQRPAAPEGE